MKKEAHYRMHKSNLIFAYVYIYAFSFLIFFSTHLLLLHVCTMFEFLLKIKELTVDKSLF